MCVTEKQHTDRFSAGHTRFHNRKRLFFRQAAAGNRGSGTTGAEMDKEVDMDGWEKAPHARKYKAILRKAGRMVENGKSGYYTIEMESLMRKIKEGLVLGETTETLDEWKEELHEIIYELTEESDV